MSVVFTYYLWPEGEERRALAVHEQQVAGAELAAAGVVVDAEREPAGVVVDAEAVGALEAHAGPLPQEYHKSHTLCSHSCLFSEHFCLKVVDLVLLEHFVYYLGGALWWQKNALL